jgi:pyruvate dehydrogenase E2 component (dihydrolipoamide acetyltransferase)
MPTPVIMPKFEMSQEAGTVMRWLKQPGETVRKGEPLLEVETDKVTMEVEAPSDGVMGEWLAAEGETVPVATVIATIVAAGETAGARQPQPSRSSQRDDGLHDAEKGRRLTPVARRVAAEAGVDPAAVAAPNGAKVTRSDVERYLAARAPVAAGPRPYATPAARRVASAHGLSLETVAGSGPDGRIQRDDVMSRLPQARPPSLLPAAPGGRDEPLSSMRRTIAARLLESYQTIPHVTFTTTADMSAVEAVRSELAAAAGKDEPRPSLTAVLVKVCAWALGRHPALNATLRGEAIHYHAAAHIGVAVALDDGLIVPVIHDAGALGLGAIAARLEDVTRRAREGTLTPGDVAGGTFTISNLGMFGIDQFTAIINPPQSAILAVGRVVRQPVAVEPAEGDRADDAIAIRPMMTMTLSADHRIIDGAVAARFLRDVVAGLERPSLLLW